MLSLFSCVHSPTPKEAKVVTKAPRSERAVAAQEHVPEVAERHLVSSKTGLTKCYACKNPILLGTANLKVVMKGKREVQRRGKSPGVLMVSDERHYQLDCIPSWIVCKKSNTSLNEENFRSSQSTKRNSSHDAAWRDAKRFHDQLPN